MADKVKVKAKRTFGLGGQVLSGECEVPADKVDLLVEKGLIEPPEKKGAADSLPEDFPGREALEGAGLTTLEALKGKSAEELTAIKGVGPATAEKILAALKGQ